VKGLHGGHAFLGAHGGKVSLEFHGSVVGGVDMRQFHIAKQCNCGLKGINISLYAR